MNRPILTVELAHAAGMDAGHASTRRAGRATWNAEDAAAAVKEEARLRGIIGGTAALEWGIVPSRSPDLKPEGPEKTPGAKGRARKERLTRKVARGRRG